MTEEDRIQKIVQYMMAHGCVKEADFKDLLCKIYDDEGASAMDEESLMQVKHSVNKRIQKYNIMLRDKADVETNERYFVLISTVDNEVTQQAAQNESAKTRELFKYVLHAITQDPRGVITEQAFKELADKARSRLCRHRSALPDYRPVLEEWLEKNWLTKVMEDGEECITLGVRAVAEFDVYIDQKLEPVCARWRK